MRVSSAPTVGSVSSFFTLFLLALLAGTAISAPPILAKANATRPDVNSVRSNIFPNNIIPPTLQQEIRARYDYDTDDAVDRHNPLFHVDISYKYACESQPGRTWIRSTHKDVCTWVNEVKLPRVHAHGVCQEQGGDGLMIPYDLRENEAVRQQTAPLQEDSTSNNPEGFWIAPEAGDSIDHWVAYEQDVTFSNWAAGQPNNWGANQYCTTFWRTVDGTWQDDNCQEFKKGICMKRFTDPGKATPVERTNIHEAMCGQTAMGCWTDHTYANRADDCWFIQNFCRGVQASDATTPFVELLSVDDNEGNEEVMAADTESNLANLLETVFPKKYSVGTSTYDTDFKDRCDHIPGAVYSKSENAESCIISDVAMLEATTSNIRISDKSYHPLVSFPSSDYGIYTNLVVSQPVNQKSVWFRCGQCIALARSGILPLEAQKPYRDFVVARCPALRAYLDPFDLPEPGPTGPA